MDTIFDKIINKEISADVIYEDEYTIAFLSIEPNNKGHTLVVPKADVRNILDFEKVDPKLRACFFDTLIKISNCVKKALKCPGLTIGSNVEEEGGQTIFKLHFHIIPRYDNNEWEEGFVEGEYESEKEKEEICKKIKSEIENY